MQKLLRQMAFCFAAGSVGALAKGGAVWICVNFAAAGLASQLARAQYPSGLYARIVWGGLAAFLFLLPFARVNWILRGLLWGAVVTVLQVFILPLLTHGGVHFALMPLLSVLALSCVWGLVTALALRTIGT